MGFLGHTATRYGIEYRPNLPPIDGPWRATPIANRRDFRLQSEYGCTAIGAGREISDDNRRLPKPYFTYAEDDQNSVILLRTALRKAGAEDCLVHAPDGDALISCLRDSIISRSLPAF